MKAWNFKVKSNPQEILKKLDDTLGSVNGFVFKMDHDKNDSVTFKVRKRSLNYLAYIRENQIVVNGKILKTDTENETDLEISFTQHFLTILYVSFFGSLGLLAIILGISSGATMYIYGGILLAIGIALWIDVQKNSKRDIQKYKTLISEILECEK
jgi:hypothetical protein